MEMPNLIDMPRRSYERFLHEGLRELFDEVSPIEDFTGGRMELTFGEYRFEEPKYTETECRDRERTFAAPLRVRVELLVKESGEVKEQEIFMGDVPMMTKHGTFIINGAERVVVSQLVRSPGAYFTAEIDPATGRKLTGAKLIPNRGAWLEFETSARDVVSVKVDRKRRIPVTVLLRAIDTEEGLTEEELGTDERIVRLLQEVDDNEEHHYLDSTLAKDTTTNKAEALEEFYRRLRPGDPPTKENALALVETLFFEDRRYDLGVVGRYKLNKRLALVDAPEQRTLRREDIVAIIRRILDINNGRGTADDIDHLGNRRVRSVGELMQNQFRVGLLRMERVVRERMTITDPDEATPSALINIRPVVAAMKEFFGGSQLSQFMDQVNPLSEIAHKRKLSALGPGGLSRDRAGFDVRDVHHSHYGRICPIETPEGPNIGLIGSLATFGVVNDFGFIETPYRVVQHEVSKNFNRQLENRIPTEDVKSATGKVLAKAGELIDEETARALADAKDDTIPVMPFITDEVKLLDAHEEEKYRIAQANSKADEHGNLYESRIEVRHGEKYFVSNPIDVDYIDVSPRQIVSVAAAMIPFLEHDDANRALMGANMQRQAVPLLRPEAPLVSTGIETAAAQDSGQVIKAEEDGEVIQASSEFLKLKYTSGREETYPLLKFVRSNQGTCINQRPVVAKGDRVRKGQPLVDSSSTDSGELALGQSMLVAFMSWEGLNFEDAIILSETVVRDDKFTSIHIEKYEVEARDTKLGPEEITRDIPNIPEEVLADLDERGIVRIGAEVGPGDILVGKVTPKGETELTPEERLVRAIFGEKAREVRDTSMKVPHGESGVVIDVRVFDREEDDELPGGVNQLVRVYVAQKRKITQGDKLAGRHGNKGVIAKILPVEDMPFMEDGTPVDIVLNPLGVPGRMNVGQIMETHLGWVAHQGWNVIGDPDWAKNLPAETRQGQPRTRVASPVFDGVEEYEIGGLLESTLVSGDADRLVNNESKARLFDGRSGEPFPDPVAVGYVYILKLLHLVDDKIHARSTGPYSMITQQPLGGKAQFGGQRFGEMEVWALEAYGAAYALQELLTIKSDDVLGRVKVYEAIVKGENIPEPGIPESFKVLVKEMQSLCLNVEVLAGDGSAIDMKDTDDEYFRAAEELGIDLSRREPSSVEEV